MTAKRTLFVDMPFRDVTGPALGVSTLAAILRRAGRPTDVRYCNIDFAASIGLDLYRFMSGQGGGVHKGEVFFTPHYFGLDVPRFIQERLLPYVRSCWQDAAPPEARDGASAAAAFEERCVQMCARDVPSFLDGVTASLPWSEYDIVGFSLMFDQTLASLCLASWIKRHHPYISVVFGGASCDGEMGVEIARAFPCIDVVAIGEADLTIVELVDAIRGQGSLAAIPGLAFRRDGVVVTTDRAPAVTDLDSLPLPDHADFVAQVQPLAIVTASHFESSRGCWWGAKSLCSFCGLNATGLSFRRKSAARVVDEIQWLISTYGTPWLLATDNIIDTDYFRTVLPALAQANAMLEPAQRPKLFYELKSNVKKPQLAIAKEAGLVAAQPGIESFNDHILGLMRKGATGIQQVQFVKWATELGIAVRYGVLHGTPGESADDYDDMASLIPYISHLVPPKYVARISIDRFSPYFSSPDAHGLTNLRPHELYETIFPDPNVRLEKIAYKFVADHPMFSDRHLSEAIARCVTLLLRWRDTFRPDRLTYYPDGEKIVVVDRRTDPPRAARLGRCEAAVVAACDEVRGYDALSRSVSNVSSAQVATIVDALVARKWMYRDGRDRCLSMLVRRPPPWETDTTSSATFF